MDPAKFIDDYLEHAYDPAKAREYYLRTRKLKGRPKAAGKPPAVDSYGNPHPSTVKKPPTQKAAPAPSRGKRVAELNARLNRLKEVLDLMQQKVDAAQARSGVEGVKKSTEKKADSAKEPSKDKSASQKTKDAKAAKERYEKNKTGETAKGAQAVQDEIEAVQKQIADAREALAAALAKMKTASPKPKTASGRPTNSKEGDRQNGA